MATVIDTPTENPEKQASGKELVWNDSEKFAFFRAAAIACQDPTVGAQMYMAQHGRKLGSAFVKDENRTKERCTTKKDGGDMDKRHWDGSLAEA